jgi:diguanylate cyclase (GGDEF)-like protein
MALALLCFLAVAYGLTMKARNRALHERLTCMQRREADVLEAARVLTAACRQSTDAVLEALDRTVRALDSAVDVVLIFEPAGEDLVCLYAGGKRTEHFRGLRVRRDDAISLPARAALCGHRVELGNDIRPVIPTDVSALAVPMLAGDRLSAVVYIASGQQRIAHAEPLVRAVAQAAAPYALATEREADRRSATYDGLTGLFTPGAFRKKLQEELARASVCGQTSLALWFIDTDHFKSVNDTLGHRAGDIVLQRMAALLRESMVTGVDIPARNGGDEFCAIVRGAPKVAAIMRAQRFCVAVRESDLGVEMPITASVGVAAYPYDATEASELLEIADAAMYHSKRAGRDRVSFAVDRATFAIYE